MKLIIDQLKECIRSHPAVINSSIGNSQNWKRTQCIILSQIISDSLSKSEFLHGPRRKELGNSISAMTLQRIFTDSYTVKENPDLRFMKTLDKLAIFLGYPSLNNFLSQTQLQEIKTESKEHNAASDTFEKLIQNYCQEEFECIQRLPEIDLGNLSDYLFADSPLIKRISDVLVKYSDLDFRVNNHENRSNFEVYDFKTVTVTENLAVLTAKEFWNIEWKDCGDNTTKAYNKINKQTYFIKKREGIWKIWDNHNPDYNGLLNEVEKAYSKENIAV
nr:hypothetical protein [uncultured Flavobacterium sp.]